jgi:predicted transcriptional regulator of viral defense system
MARLTDILATGATAAAVSRLEREGSVIRLSRGLYQLSDAPLGEHHVLAEASRLIPKGVICLISALAFHELTDRIPSRVWVAIGAKDWKPHRMSPPLRIVRFSNANLTNHVSAHLVEGVEVRVTDAARTIVDCFRYRSSVGVDVAIDGLKEALRTRKASTAEIDSIARELGQAKAMRPYLETAARFG